MSYILRRNCS